jgi:hypothetical protein
MGCRPASFLPELYWTATNTVTVARAERQSYSTVVATVWFRGNAAAITDGYQVRGPLRGGASTRFAATIYS